ncbi:MAG: dephospho-CoA kinase [Elusimicrobiota bacterium]
MKTFILGLTGTVGSGKTTAGNILASFGAGVISADNVCKSLYIKNGYLYNELIKNFGRDILGLGDEVDRGKLRDILMTNPKSLAEINAITHDFIINDILNRIETIKLETKVVVIDVPLLYETGMDKDTDKVLVITAEKNIIQKRLANDRNWGRGVFEFFLQNQMSNEEKVKKADYVIENNDSIELLKARLKEFWESESQKWAK